MSSSARAAPQVPGVEVRGEAGAPAGRHDEARQLLEQVALADEFEPFLTLPVYERLG